MSVQLTLEQWRLKQFREKYPEWTMGSLNDILFFIYEETGEVVREAMAIPGTGVGTGGPYTRNPRPGRHGKGKLMIEMGCLYAMVLDMFAVADINPGEALGDFLREKGIKLRTIRDDELQKVRTRYDAEQAILEMKEQLAAIHERMTAEPEVKGPPTVDCPCGCGMPVTETEADPDIPVTYHSVGAPEGCQCAECQGDAGPEDFGIEAAADLYEKMEEQIDPDAGD